MPPSRIESYVESIYREVHVSQFQQPGISNPEDKFVPAENKGALLLFFPTQLQSQIKTAHGDSDAVHATVIRLNDGRVFDNALIFPTALVTQLKGAIPDGMVLGTLGQGENTKGNPPWLLQPHTEQDVQLAEQWLAANPRNQFSQPQAQAAPPTAPAWNAPATPAAPAWGGQAAAPAAPARGNPPTPAPTATVDPGLVAAIESKGYKLPPGATQQTAEQLWAFVSTQ